MRIIFVILLILIPGSITFAQELPGGQFDRYEIAPRKTNAENKAMVIAKYKLTTNDNYSMNDIGIRIGIYATEDLVIGAHYFYLFDNSVVFSPNNNDLKAALLYDLFGVNVDYFVSNSYSLPISIGLNLGTGQATFTSFGNSPVSDDLTGDWLFSIEPEANIFFHLTNTLLVDFNVGYRLISDLEYSGIENSDISGFVGGIGIALTIQ
ncbi:MAG: hypothetical protein KDC55_01595 [Ignavibacteriae bacterium]|nr:hypothetical protein [Ignavibacteriota bacterium]MCB9221242.1 hypothetical protein [Ignavibacteria bacterium]